MVHQALSIGSVHDEQAAELEELVVELVRLERGLVF
jgi:hypothetical protein